MNNMQTIREKIFRGCGCLSIGFVVSLVILAIIGYFLPDEEGQESESPVAQQVEQRDSVVVNEPLEGDPYQELDDLIGLENVKKEVRSLANFVKLHILHFRG